MPYEVVLYREVLYMQGTQGRPHAQDGFGLALLCLIYGNKQNSRQPFNKASLFFESHLPKHFTIQVWKV